MIKNLKESLIPLICLTILVGLSFLFGLIEYESQLFMNFLLGALLLLIGQVLFLTGAENSVVKIGQHAGTVLVKFKKIWIILIFAGLFGLITTVAEPDLQLLSKFIDTVALNFPKILFMLLVGLGVGIFTLLAFVRILKNISIKYVLLCIYALIFIFAFFLPSEFVSLSFDASGMSTGTMAVPFMLALTAGICKIRTVGKKEDNFGVIAIASSGAILFLEIGFLFFPMSKTNFLFYNNSFTDILLNNIVEVTISILPILVVYIVFQIFYFKFPKKYFLRLLFSLVITSVGLILFVTGVMYGLSPMGLQLGYKLNIFPITVLTILFGAVLIFTEPAILLLLKQIESITSGIVKKKYIIFSLICAVILALVLSLLKIIFSINILWFVAPIVFLIFLFGIFTPNLFFSIGFDSGGVVSGTILVAFVLPFLMGFSSSLNSSTTDAFGTIALVSTLPILAIEILGLVFKHITNKYKQKIIAEEKKLIRKKKREERKRKKQKMLANLEIQSKQVKQELKITENIAKGKPKPNATNTEKVEVNNANKHN